MPSSTKLPARRRFFLLAALAVMFSACGDATKVDDPQLKPIQEMLDAQLPPGTPIGLVNQWVNARGYPFEPAGQPDAEQPESQPQTQPEPASPPPQ